MVQKEEEKSLIELSSDIVDMVRGAFVSVRSNNYKCKGTELCNGTYDYPRGV